VGVVSEATNATEQQKNTRNTIAILDWLASCLRDAIFSRLDGWMDVNGCINSKNLRSSMKDVCCLVDRNLDGNLDRNLDVSVYENVIGKSV
jgi:hypothetical protein